MTDGGGSGYFWIDTLKNNDRRSKSSIKRVVVYVLLITGFLVAIIFSSIAIKDNYNKIYNEGLSLLES